MSDKSFFISTHIACNSNPLRASFSPPFPARQPFVLASWQNPLTRMRPCPGKNVCRRLKCSGSRWHLDKELARLFWPSVINEKIFILRLCPIHIRGTLLPLYLC